MSLTVSSCIIHHNVSRLYQSRDGILILLSNSSPHTANPRALRRLKAVMSESSLESHVFFHRPDFEKILEHHALSMIRNHEYSSSLLTFCGSKHVSAAVERAKIANDLTVAMSGYRRHHMEFKSECNGCPKTGKA